MELPGGGDEWLAPSPSPPGPAVPDRHDEHGVGTFIWPPVGTSTWPPVGTFSWPRTRRSSDFTGQLVTALRYWRHKDLTTLPRFLAHYRPDSSWFRWVAPMNVLMRCCATHRPLLFSRHPVSQAISPSMSI